MRTLTSVLVAIVFAIAFSQSVWSQSLSAGGRSLKLHADVEGTTRATILKSDAIQDALADQITDAEVLGGLLSTLNVKATQLTPTTCGDTQKLTHQGSAWLCQPDLLGCPPKAASLTQGAYSCGVSLQTGAQWFKTPNLACDAAPCVGGDQLCPKTCYSPCNCVTDKKGNTSCASCPYDCSYTICRERHYVRCTGQFLCDQDQWNAENHTCTVQRREIATCN